MPLSNLEWTFSEEINIPAELEDLLAEGEEAYRAFRTIRDVAMFTNKRLIVSDAQGLTGRKKEIYSLPYKSVVMWSTENAGTFDINSEVELWTRAGNIKINLNSSIDIREFDRLLSRVCL